MEDIEDCGMKIWWTVTVWPKWQIVIPKEVRDLLQIWPWDSLVAISKWKMAVGFVKNWDMQKMIEYIQQEIK